jgi:hypothetical protein
MKSNRVSESHQNNNLKVVIAFARNLGSSSFVDINTNESITDFLNTNLKSIEDDPDRKCLTTWNDYLGRLKLQLMLLTHKYIFINFKRLKFLNETFADITKMTCFDICIKQ